MHFFKLSAMVLPLLPGNDVVISFTSDTLTNWGLVICFALLVMMAKEKPPITVVGDVGGRIAIIVVWSRVILHVQR